MSVSGSSLTDETNQELVKILFDKSKKNQRFADLCNERTDLFGTPGSKLRRSVQNRRTYLLGLPAQKFLRAAQEAFDGEDLPVEIQDAFVSSFDTASVRSQRSQRTQRIKQTPPRPPPTAHLQSPPTFASPPIPRNIMASFGNNDEDDDLTMTLNVRQPIRNPVTIFPIRGAGVKDGNKLVDKLSIWVSVIDIRDVKAGLYKGRLTADFDGVIITRPSLPRALREVDCMHDLEDKECIPTKTAHEVAATEIEINDDIETTEDTYWFPKEHGVQITCNNKHFNDSVDSDPYSLTMYFRLRDVEIGKKQAKCCDDSCGVNLVCKVCNKIDHELSVVQFIPFVVFKMAINGEEKTTKPPSKKSTIDGVTGALGKLGISGI